MEQLRAESLRLNTEHEEAMARHDSLLDEQKCPVVRFLPASVAANAIPYDGLVAVWSPSATTSEPFQVGKLQLSPRGRELRLDRIVTFGFAGHRGFGSAALRLLVKLAREAGYGAIVGEVKPETLDDLDHLRAWYCRNGFEVDHGKVRNALYLSLTATGVAALGGSES